MNRKMVEHVNLEPYLDDVELVDVGGASDKDARPLDYDWALDIREQCIRKQGNKRRKKDKRKSVLSLLSFFEC